MKLSNKIYIHYLTIFFFFISFITGYAKYLFFVFLIVLIHEMGHVVIAKLLKRKITKIEILPFGGLTKMDSLISANIYEDLIIAVGGILTQVLFGFYLNWMYEHFTISESAYQFLKNFNITIIIFNLLPICPLDGYKILKLGTELFLPFRLSFPVAEVLSFAVLFILAIANINIIKSNIFVFIFMVFMIIEEIKNTKYILNRFYLERLNHDFDYRKIEVKTYKNMFKNRINYIKGEHEKKVLLRYFSRKNN